MPKKDFGDSGSLLSDLFRELSPLVRIFLFLGLAAGLGVGLYFSFALGADGVSRLAGRFAVLATFGLIIAGGFAGVVIGVVIEMIVQSIWRPKKPGKRERPRRRRTI